MRTSWTAIAVGCGLGLGALAAGSASAATTIYNFTGACSDCAGSGTGTLTLQNAPAGTLTKADFVSFLYKSNLVSFQINSNDIVAVMGSMDPNNLGKSYVDIIQLGGTGWEFVRNTDGSWSVSSNLSRGMAGGGGSGGSGGGGGGGGGGAFSGGGGGLQTSGPGGSDFSGGYGASVGTAGGAGTDDFGSSSDLVAVAVPEPAAWALMIMGFGGMGAALRARRRLAPAG